VSAAAQHEWSTAAVVGSEPRAKQRGATLAPVATRSAVLPPAR
jgi:hypothetical protein